MKVTAYDAAALLDFRPQTTISFDNISAVKARRRFGNTALVSIRDYGVDTSFPSYNTSSIKEEKNKRKEEKTWDCAKSPLCRKYTSFGGAATILRNGAAKTLQSLPVVEKIEDGVLPQGPNMCFI